MNLSPENKRCDAARRIAMTAVTALGHSHYNLSLPIPELAFRAAPMAGGLGIFFLEMCLEDEDDRTELQAVNRRRHSVSCLGRLADKAACRGVGGYTAMMCLLRVPPPVAKEALTLALDADTTINDVLAAAFVFSQTNTLGGGTPAESNENAVDAMELLWRALKRGLESKSHETILRALRVTSKAGPTAEKAINTLIMIDMSWGWTFGYGALTRFTDSPRHARAMMRFLEQHRPKDLASFAADSGVLAVLRGPAAVGEPAAKKARCDAGQVGVLATAAAAVVPVRATWQFKADLRKLDTTPGAWADYGAADSAKIEGYHAEWQAAKKKLNKVTERSLSAEYMVSFKDLIQYQTKDSDRQRPIRRVI